MKTRGIVLFLMLFAISPIFIFGQTIELTFTGEEETLSYVTLDSIFIRNITKDVDTMLIGVDTTLLLDLITGTIENAQISKPFELVQNYPNPYRDRTAFAVTVFRKENLEIMLFDLYGQKLTELKGIFEVGTHLFTLTGNQSKFYLLTVIGQSLSSSIKLISSHPTGGVKHSITYAGNQPIHAYYKNTMEKNGFPYTIGDELVCIGYANDYENSIIVDSPYVSKDYIFQFVLIDNFLCGTSFVDIRDNIEYQTIQIGEQCWMKENLNWEAEGSWCYENVSTNCEIYGRLYNWEAVMNGDSSSNTVPSGVQGICPDGWHVPSDTEWCIVTKQIDPTVNCIGAGYYSGTDAGIKMKNETGWNNNGNGSNESGFSGLPGGGYYSNIFWNDLGDNANFWSSLEWSADGAGVWRLSCNEDGVNRDVHNKSTGISLRCIKNNGSLSSPNIETGSVFNISSTSVNVDGEILYIGNSDIIQYGHCWSINTNPTIDDIITSLGSSSIPETFTSNLINLQPGTNYYVRAYAFNSNGISYGTEIIFSTSPMFPDEPCPGMPSVTWQGQTYNTAQIGEQCWLRENLNWDTGPSWCYNNDTSNCDIYGRLYMWETIMNGANSSNLVPSGVQGICPDGWHIPSDGEWTILANTLGGDSLAGGKMKHAGTTIWLPPNYGATNESGFTALPAGGNGIGGAFAGLGASTSYWTTSEFWINPNFAFVRALGYNSISLSSNSVSKLHGRSARCIKDITGQPNIKTGLILNITTNSAEIEGEIIDIGNSEIIQYGHCWSKNPYPTYNDSITIFGPTSNTGIFTSNLTDLQPEKTYYVRAYALNSEGISYDSQVVFGTLPVLPPEPCPSAPFVTWQGQTYGTVQIGEQCWMRENLNWETGISWCYDNEPANCAIYGRLYDWGTIMNGANSSNLVPSGVQGICPDGWHVPSDAEWCIVTQHIDPTVDCDAIGFSGTDAGIKMKNKAGWYFYGDGSNEAGFSALPGGYYNGYFWNLGYWAVFWSTTSGNIRELRYNDDKISRSYSGFEIGHSLRCIKD